MGWYCGRRIKPHTIRLDLFNTEFMGFQIMKKSILVPAMMLASMAAVAQSSIDAYTLSQGELRGTARFMSMAGAFTALGGDISTLNQNPAGIGVYRGSDVGLTLDINMMNSKTSGISGAQSWSNTHADVNNFGYIGTFNIGNPVMQTFSWGVSYGRRNSFERHYRGSGAALNTSLSNYVAYITDGVDPWDMDFNESQDYNPYRDTDINWLSILSYSGRIVNPLYTINPDFNPNRPVNADNPEYLPTNSYEGLFEYGTLDGIIKPTVGTAGFSVSEKGYVDEYSLNFGGNLANVVYWGLGIGITDLSFEQQTYYDESLRGANIPRLDNTGIEEGNCDFELANYRKITGTGVNVKFGLIYKPINELRIGFAIHSPTYYSLRTTYQADLSFGASNGCKADEHTDVADYNWNLKSPWRMMVGVAGVIGGRGILSADYEYQAYRDMKTSDSYGDFDFFNEDIHAYFQSTNTLRLGAEFRVTPRFSIRAGYSYSSSAVKDDVQNNNLEVYTSGCNPSYTLNNATSYITAGLGYRIGGFYADLAYAYKHLTSEWHGFTSFKDYDEYWYDGPQAKVTTNSNHLVLTLGYKF